MAHGDILYTVFRKKIGQVNSNIITEIDEVFPPDDFEIIGVHPVNETGGRRSIKANYIVIARELPDVPEAVSDLTAMTGAGSGEVQLDWTAPSDGGSPITDYRIEFIQGAGSFSVFIHTASPAVTIIVNGLAPGLSYAFQIFAINAQGTGPVSNPDTATSGA